MSPLAQAFSDQATACRNLGSPFMGRLCGLLAQDWPGDTALAAACDAFAGDPGPAGVSVPLRVTGGLHALRLQGDADLAALYPPNQPGEDAFRAGILAAIRRHVAFLTEWIKSPPQTNEIRRSAALIPGARLAAARFGLPVMLSELGASGGLNLLWDRFALAANGWRVGPENAALTLTPDWTGDAPDGADAVIAERRGVDLNPIDPGSSEGLLRLTAYLWADQPERLKMTRAAAATGGAPLDRADAIDWLEARLASAPEGRLHIIQNTIAWQYFPAASQARGRSLIETAGAQATPDRPLAWLQLESDGDRHGLGGAAISLRLWPGGEHLSMGRADFHGRWVHWSPAPAAT